MATASIYDVLTTQWVKDVYLAGVDLTDDSGNAFSDDMYEASLRKAVAETEQELDIVLDPIQVTSERHDLTQRERQAYWPYYLYHRPVIGIDGLKCKFGGTEVMDIPTAWVDVQEARHAYLHIIPRSEQIQNLNPIFVASLSAFRYDYVPGWFEFSYRAGFRVYTSTVSVLAGATEADVTFAAGEIFPTSGYFAVFDLVSPNAADADIVCRLTTRTTTGMKVKFSKAPANALTVRWYVTDFPDNLRALVGIRAAKTPLTIAGDLVMGSGILSSSIGLDGLSQSRSTTKSAMGGAYAGRLKSLMDEEDRIVKSLKAAYGSMNWSAI